MWRVYSFGVRKAIIRNLLTLIETKKGEKKENLYGQGLIEVGKMFSEREHKGMRIYIPYSY